MRDVYLVGAYAIPFGKYGDSTFRELTRQAVEGVLADVQTDVGEVIDSVWYGNVMMNFWEQHSTRGQFACSPLVEDGILPRRVAITNVEGACATGSMAFQGSVKDIRSGEAEVSLAIGVEKIYRPGVPSSEIFSMFRVAENALNPEETLKEYERLEASMGGRFETAPDRTMFMDTYATQAKYHMHKYGLTNEQLAIVAAKNHNNAVENDRAQYRFPMTVDEVLADRLVSYPFTRSMCAPIGDGAAATLVVSEEKLGTLPEATRKRAIRVAASVLTSGVYRQPDEASLSAYAAKKAYDIANLKPDDIDIAEVHDATAFGEIYQSEMMGFCATGEGGLLAASGATAIDGSIPINTSGGLLSKGHPVAASGLSMIAEITEQLRNEAGPRQVRGAKTGLIENGGGIMGLEEAACGVTILQKV